MTFVSWLRKTFSRFAGGKLTKSTALVASGTAGAQGLAVFALPVLTRIYSPESFGHLAVYSSLLAIIVAVAAWRYPFAIPLPSKDEDGWRLVIFSGAALVITTLLVLVAIVTVIPLGTARWGWSPGIITALYLLPIGVFLMGFFQIAMHWAIRCRAYASLAMGKLSQGVVQIVSQIGAGFIGFGTLGLVGGDSIGRGAGALGVFRATRKNWTDLKFGTLGEIWTQAKRYKSFPLISSWSSILNSSGPHLAPLLVTIAFGPALGGIFLVANRIATIPSALVGHAAAAVISGEAARRQREGRSVYSMYKRSLLKAGIFAIVVMSAAAAILTPTLPTILGIGWDEGAIMFLLLIPLATAQLTVAPMSRGLLIMEKQGVQLAWDTGRIVIAVAPFVFAAYGLLGIRLTIAIYSALGSVAYFVQAGLILRHARKQFPAIVS